MRHKGWSSVRPFFDMGSPVKTQVENGLSTLFDFRGQTINTSDQAVFTLNDSGRHDDDGKKINISEPLTAAQRRLCSFPPFIMAIQTDQAEPNCKPICMTCRACVQLPIDVYGIDAGINIKMTSPPTLPLMIFYSTWRL